jgi:hypothetical protein
MEISRSFTYKQNRELAQQKDNRAMDDICSNSNNTFELQVQQQFMKKMIHKAWKHMLLYHGIGSGKTCTAITMAEEYLVQNPGGGVTVILPARLKTNFLDELISQCGFERYISNEDFMLYNDSNVDASTKVAIKKKFMAKIRKSYEIVTFEGFVASAKKSTDLRKWVTDFTKDRFIIIDEVHNMINTTYKDESYNLIQTLHRIPSKVDGVRTLVFKYFVEHSSERDTKMIFMTATPVFDNVNQFKELVAIMSGVDKKLLRNTKIAIENLRGMVSYFPGTSPNAYPAVTYVNEDIKMSKKQESLFLNDASGSGSGSNSSSDDENPLSDAFLSKQRQIGIVGISNKTVINPTIMDKIVSNLQDYSPKIKKMVKIITSKKEGKHVVFSNFVSKGLSIIEAVLKLKGWVSYIDVLSNPDLAKKHAYKVYVLWDGALKDNHKQATKAMINSKANIAGKLIKVVLGSPSIKEGVSFKHVQHLHMLDPVWNNSAKIQVEGRAVRFCSHTDIPQNSRLKREVVIHLYKIVPRSKSMIEMTADQKIYDIIIPQKMDEVSVAEKALKVVAIDYYLFRNMYEEKMRSSPNTLSDISELELSDEVVLRKKESKKEIERNTCPSKRRPNKEGQCTEGHIPKLNKQGALCCYVDRKKKTQK